jgi:hypothetical protein
MSEEVREFALHWNNFTENVVNSFQQLHKQQELCDVTLGNKNHKNLLPPDSILNS